MVKNALSWFSRVVLAGAAMMALLLSPRAVFSIEESKADWDASAQGKWTKGAPLWVAVSLRGKPYSDAGPEARLGPIITQCFEIGIAAWELELRREGETVLAVKGVNRPLKYQSGEYQYLLTKPSGLARFLVRLPPLPDDVGEGSHVLRLRMHDRPLGNPKLERSKPLSPWLEMAVIVVEPSQRDQAALAGMQLGGEEWFMRAPELSHKEVSPDVADATWFDNLVRTLAVGEPVDQTARESAPAFFRAEMLALRLEAMTMGGDSAKVGEEADLGLLLEAAGLGWMVDRMDDGRGGIAAVARRCRDWELAKRVQQERGRDSQRSEPNQ